MRRATTGLVSRILVGMMLLTQLAVAAYACPGLMPSLSAGVSPVSMMIAAGRELSSGGAAAASETVSGTDTPCSAMLGQLDPVASSLCVEHCLYGQQKVDPLQPTPLPVASFNVHYAVPTPGAHCGSAGLLSSAGAPSAAVFPPHAILHCCFRI